MAATSCWIACLSWLIVRGDEYKPLMSGSLKEKSHTGLSLVTRQANRGQQPEILGKPGILQELL